MRRTTKVAISQAAGTDPKMTRDSLYRSLWGSKSELTCNKNLGMLFKGCRKFKQNRCIFFTHRGLRTSLLYLPTSHGSVSFGEGGSTQYIMFFDILFDMLLALNYLPLLPGEMWCWREVPSGRILPILSSGRPAEFGCERSQSTRSSWPTIRPCKKKYL